MGSVPGLSCHAFGCYNAICSYSGRSLPHPTTGLAKNGAPLSRQLLALLVAQGLIVWFDRSIARSRQSRDADFVQLLRIDPQLSLPEQLELASQAPVRTPIDKSTTAPVATTPPSANEFDARDVELGREIGRGNFGVVLAAKCVSCRCLKARSRSVWSSRQMARSRYRRQAAPAGQPDARCADGHRAGSWADEAALETTKRWYDWLHSRALASEAMGLQCNSKARVSAAMSCGSLPS